MCLIFVLIFMASVIVRFVSVGLWRFVLTLCFCFFLWRAGACGFDGGGGEGERRSTPETLMSPSATSSLELLFMFGLWRFISSLL